MSDRQGVGRDDLDECWCCDGLHDSLGALCPACDEAGCQHFGGECQSDHKPVMPDGGRPGVGADRLHGSNGDLGLERWCRDCDEWVMLSDWQDHALHYPQEDSQP